MPSCTIVLHTSVHRMRQDSCISGPAMHSAAACPPCSFQSSPAIPGVALVDFLQVRGCMLPVDALPLRPGKGGSCVVRKMNASSCSGSGGRMRSKGKLLPRPLGPASGHCPSLAHPPQLAINSIRHARGQPDLDPFEGFAFVAGKACRAGQMQHDWTCYGRGTVPALQAGPRKGRTKLARYGRVGAACRARRGMGKLPVWRFRMTACCAAGHRPWDGPGGP